jgi:trimethylamine--corrinoid protein Co-methyltransferase
MDTIHAYSLELLHETGIRFPSEKALALFKRHGFKVDGPMVHFEEQDIQKALKTVPSAFTIEARNPSRNIRIGENHFVMAPGYGTPFIIEPSGEKRNATLAGICLAQLMNPGMPLVYGLAGNPMDMRTGGYVSATPEDVKHVAIVSAIGRYYNMPCRSQGALTDSFCLDYQAGLESTVMMTVAALSGVHVSLHACGTFGSLLAMSFEKFIADEDLCGALKRLMQPVELTDDAFALDLIKKVGSSGNYLTETHTVNRCRDEFFIPDLIRPATYDKWLEMEPRDISARAKNLLEKRLAEYEKPEMDPKLEKRLIQYVADRKHN